jgi:integrase
MLYKRGRTWWYKFMVHGRTVYESTGLTNKSAAGDVERTRHTALKESAVGISKRKRVPLFDAAAETYQAAMRDEWEPKTIANTELSFRLHLTPFFRTYLLSDVGVDDVIEYRQSRAAEGAAPKSITNELGCLRALLRFHDLDAVWSAIAKKVKMQKAAKVGRAIRPQEETALLSACRASRSRSLYPAVVIAIEAGLRYNEIRLLQWINLDFQRKLIIVGKSKTDAGEGREVPLTNFAYQTLQMWAAHFPERKLNQFVFPSEKAGQSAVVYDIDVTKPIGTWKEAWEAAKKRAGVSCRFHDLRHTCCTHLLDAGVSFPIAAEILGWSASTAVRMAREIYGHVGLHARQQAVAKAEQFRRENAAGWLQNLGQSTGPEKVQ